ncbi:SCO4225 family membrane protein [Saccharopolyspora sp. 6M]|uniref:SCO4225 family membrane protein n=1 Tax=Saccharopolyspora sp. 6M TaxID=2877237 RepID=UPI001CD5ED48|nr:hypothetical protein [Saccharopolyspora sp. 6M]MCA1224977.1 hypothetical protein [Saccharopolyspora sp. 6M]
MHGPRRTPATAALHRYLFNPAGLGYLALVAVVWAWIALDVLLFDHTGNSLVGMWGFLVTAPTSLVFVQLSGPALWGGVLLAAVLQALLLGVTYAGVPAKRTRSRKRRTGTTGKNTPKRRPATARRTSPPRARAAPGTR